MHNVSFYSYCQTAGWWWKSFIILFFTGSVRIKLGSMMIVFATVARGGGGGGNLHETFFAVVVLWAWTHNVNYCHGVRGRVGGGNPLPALFFRVVAHWAKAHNVTFRNCCQRAWWKPLYQTFSAEFVYIAPRPIMTKSKSSDDATLISPVI